MRLILVKDKASNAVFIQHINQLYSTDLYQQQATSFGVRVRTGWKVVSCSVMSAPPACKANLIKTMHKRPWKAVVVISSCLCSSATTCRLPTGPSVRHRAPPTRVRLTPGRSARVYKWLQGREQGTSGLAVRGAPQGDTAGSGVLHLASVPFHRVLNVAQTHLLLSVSMSPFCRKGRSVLTHSAVAVLSCVQERSVGVTVWERCTCSSISYFDMF